MFESNGKINMMYTLSYVNKISDVKDCTLCLFLYVLIYKHSDSISKSLKTERKGLIKEIYNLALFIFFPHKKIKRYSCLI